MKQGTENDLPHPEGKKRKSSEGNSFPIHPSGRHENAGKTGKPRSTIAILWPVFPFWRVCLWAPQARAENGGRPNSLTKQGISTTFLIIPLSSRLALSATKLVLPPFLEQRSRNKEMLNVENSQNMDDRVGRRHTFICPIQ